MSGTLSDWDIRERIGGIAVPALVTAATYAVESPALAKEVYRALPHAWWALFRRSSGTPYLEEAARYRSVIGRFMEMVERGG